LVIVSKYSAITLFLREAINYFILSSDSKMTTVTLQPDHAYVLAMVGAIHLTNVVLGGTIGLARKKYGVAYPNLYATHGMYIKDGKLDEREWLTKGEEFNKRQRGHQHMLETIGDVYAMMITCGFFYPTYAAQLGVMWILGSIVYAYGYSVEPKARSFGQMIYLPAHLGWFYGLYCAGSAIYYGKAL